MNISSQLMNKLKEDKVSADIFFLVSNKTIKTKGSHSIFITLNLVWNISNKIQIPYFAIEFN